MKMKILHIDICGIMLKWGLEVSLEPQLHTLKSRKNVMCYVMNLENKGRVNNKKVEVKQNKDE